MSNRIGLVCKSLDPERGGHEQYLNRLLRGLKTNGYDITVFAQDFHNVDLEDFGIKPVTIPVLKFEGGLRRLTHSYFARRKVNQYLHGLDLVFTTGKVDFGDVYRAGGGVHATYVENCVKGLARYKPKHQASMYLQKRLFNQNTPRLIITNSKMVRKDILDRFNVNSNRISVIYNGVDTDRFNYQKLKKRRKKLRNKHGYSSNDFVSLFVAGGAWKRKGLPLVLEGIDQIEDESLKLLIVGKTKKDLIQQKISQKTFNNQIKLTGYVDDVESYYALSDIMVLPSKYDSGANVIIEALASGLPVITTKTNGTHELIKSGENGYVIDGEPNGAKILDTILSMQRETQLETFRDSAAEVGQKYSVDRHLNQLTNCLSSNL